MLARLSALTLWALVAATAVFWGLRLLVRAPSVPGNAVAVSAGATTTGDLTRLLGAPPVEAEPAVVVSEVASRFKLVGVMAPKATGAEVLSSYGVALIAVDGKPAKAFQVGASLDGALVLQSVGMRSASLGPAEGAASVKLELPALPQAATGTLPNFGISTAGGPSPAATPGSVGTPMHSPGPRMARPMLPPPSPMGAEQGQSENFGGAATE